MAYTSRAHLFGLPLVDVQSGTVDASGYHRGVARGWIAVGDVALGALFAIGGVAVSGGIAIGGVSLGMLGLGGLACGGVALGGAAFGIYAVGGLAVGLRVALGGVALARDFALGGFEYARHVRDDEARLFFSANPLYWLASEAASYTWQLLGLPLLLSLGFRRRSGG